MPECFIILEVTGGDCGRYTSFSNLKWGSVVEAEQKGSALFIKGEELIKIGADPELIVPHRKYMWGSFESVEGYL